VYLSYTILENSPKPYSSFKQKAWHVPLKDQLYQLKDLPLYLIYGEHDWIDFRFAAKVRREILYQTKIFLLPNAGHHGYVEAADLLSYIVSNLNRDLSSVEYDGNEDNVRRRTGLSIA
jgi:pimeloyl-ACP methyl ester carboxylesterase